MTNTQAPHYLTLKQYAAALGKSKRTIHRWLAEGIITSDKKLPGATGDHLFLSSRVEDARVA